MKTYEICKDNGNQIAFEFDSIYLSLTSLCSLLKSIDGVSDIRRRNLMSESPDVHVKFKYFDDELIILEPFGDSSRYWCGFESNDNIKHLQGLEECFKFYKPSVFRKIIGDIITLNFINYKS